MSNQKPNFYTDTLKSHNRLNKSFNVTQITEYVSKDLNKLWDRITALNSTTSISLSSLNLASVLQIGRDADITGTINDFTGVLAIDINNRGLSGNWTAVTQAPGTNNSTVATTAFVTAAITAAGTFSAVLTAGNNAGGLTATNFQGTYNTVGTRELYGYTNASAANEAYFYGINNANGDYFIVGGDTVIANSPFAYLSVGDGTSVTGIQAEITRARIGGTSASFIGAAYDADYSANYTTRSLVDKGYVTGVASALTLSAVLVNGNTTGVKDIIVTNGQSIYSQSGNNQSLVNYLANTITVGVNDSVTNVFAYTFWDNTTPASPIMETDIQDSLSNTTSFYIGINDANISGTKAGFKGITYGADYSANYTTRSLIDKGYLTSVLASYPTGSGAANRVAYWSGASTLTSSANLTFDGNSLTVGTSVISPIMQGSTAASGSLTLMATSNATDGAIIFQSDSTTERARILSTGELIMGAATLLSTEYLSIQKSQNASTHSFIYNGTSGTAAQAAMYVLSGSLSGIGIHTLSAGYTTSGMLIASNTAIRSTLGNLQIGTANASSYMALWTSNSERVRILTTGELIHGGTALISAEVFSIQKNQNAGTYQLISNTTSGTGAYTATQYSSNTANLWTGALSTLYTTSGLYVAQTAFVASTSGAGINMGTTNSAQVSLWTNNTKRVDISSAGQVTFYARGTTTSTSTSVTFTSAHYGLAFLWSPTGIATATLPANGAAAGSWFDVILLTNQTITISAATADTLITVNDTAADSVAFSTAGQKIGAMVRFISNGSVWIAVNLGTNTMTVAT